MWYKITRKITSKFKGKLVEKKIQKVKVYNNEGKRKYERVIGFRNTYYYPKDKNRMPDLNWSNRNQDNNDYKNPSLFSDVIISNLRKLCLELHEKLHENDRN